MSGPLATMLTIAGASRSVPADSSARQRSIMKVNPFYTTTPEHGARHRDVYHDNNQCADGKRIRPEHRVSGTGGRPKCDECKTLS